MEREIEYLKFLDCNCPHCGSDDLTQGNMRDVGDGTGNEEYLCDSCNRYFRMHFVTIYTHLELDDPADPGSFNSPDRFVIESAEGALRQELDELLDYVNGETVAPPEREESETCSR